MARKGGDAKGAKGGGGKEQRGWEGGGKGEGGKTDYYGDDDDNVCRNILHLRICNALSSYHDQISKKK